MKIAFNAKLNTKVTAEEAYKTRKWSDGFLCPYCGRAVSLIFPGGTTTDRSPYFRHQRGSYATDCEEYSAAEYQYYQSHGNSFSRDTGIKREFEAHLCLSCNKGCEYFSINIRMSTSFIQQHESDILSLVVKKSSTSMELPHKYVINHGNFIPMQGWEQKLNVLGDEVEVAIEKEILSVPFLNTDAVFFEPQGDVDLSVETDYLAEHIETKNLFVGQDYIVVSKYDIFLVDFEGVQFFRKRKISNYFVAGVIFGDYTTTLANFCNSLGYVLHKEREGFSAIWPPTFTSREGLFSDADSLFVSTNFPIVPEKNIDGSYNVISENLYEIFLYSPIKILCNEKVTAIQKSPLVWSLSDNNKLELEVVKTKEHFVSLEQNGLLIADAQPVLFVKEGTQIWLTNDKKLAYFDSNYLVRLVYVEAVPETSLAETLIDIQKNYKAVVPIESDDLMIESNDEYLVYYLNQCRHSKKINLAIRNFCAKEKNND